MVGFQDPRKSENESAMKALQRLDQETKKVKKWLAYLMDPRDEDNANVEEATPSEQPAVDDIGLLGGMTTVSSPTVNLPSYKPSLRTDLGNTILLTGTYHPALLRALNNNDFGNRSDGGGGESGDLIPNFQFEKIILSIQGEDMAKEAKKRVISREARYSGLLNKVVIEAEESYLPNTQRMEGVSSWIVRLDAGETAEMLPKIAELAKTAETLKNVIVIVEGMTSMTSDVEGWDILLAEDSFQSTLLAVGELYDEGDAGKFYHIGNYQAGPSSAIELTNDDAKSPKMLREDAYFTLANLLALNVSANKALVAYEYSPTTMQTVRSSIEEAKKIIKEGETEPTDAPDDDVWKGIKYTNRVVRAMREMGFSRLGELDVLLARGVDVSCSSLSYTHYLCNHTTHHTNTLYNLFMTTKGYIEFLNAPPKRSMITDAQKEKEEWEKKDDELMAKFDEELAQRKAQRELEEAKATMQEIKDMARDWAIRQYALKSLNNEVGNLTERQFIQSIWQDALEEGRKMYDVVHSEEYEERMMQTQSTKQSYFYKGMDKAEKKKREILLEKVMSQYLESYVGDEELEESSGSSEESMAVDK
eukprot:scaffold3667_cov63-Cyclotella_meneghiniana.AAC.4